MSSRTMEERSNLQEMALWVFQFVSDYPLPGRDQASKYKSFCVEFKNLSDSYIAPGERPPVDPWRGRRVPIHGVIEPQMPTVDDG